MKDSEILQFSKVKLTNPELYNFSFYDKSSASFIPNDKSPLDSNLVKFTPLIIRASAIKPSITPAKLAVIYSMVAWGISEI